MIEKETGSNQFPVKIIRSIESGWKCLEPEKPIRVGDFFFFQCGGESQSANITRYSDESKERSVQIEKCAYCACRGCERRKKRRWKIGEARDGKKRKEREKEREKARAVLDSR